jgi:hypothetical protein
MGVIPLQTVSPAKDRSHCRLCAKARRRESARDRALRQLREAAPYAVGALLGIALGMVDNATVRAIGLGVIAGTATTVMYLYARRQSLETAVDATHDRELAEVTADADARVQAVITQFEWAVNDVATLRRRLEASEAEVRTLGERAREREHQNEQLVRQISHLRERLTEIAMAASLRHSGKDREPRSEPIVLSWRVEHDEERARLRLQARASSDAPTRVRIMDRDGEIAAATCAAAFSADGRIEFQLEPPLDLLDDLAAGRAISYEIEALVGPQWRSVRLGEQAKRPVRGELLRLPGTEGDETAHAGARVSRRSRIN